MASKKSSESAKSAYQLHLFSNIPLYTTRLVCETRFPFCDRIQVSRPADVAPILQEYFRDKDREEFIVVLLDSGHTIIGSDQRRWSGCLHRRAQAGVHGRCPREDICSGFEPRA